MQTRGYRLSRGAALSGALALMIGAIDFPARAQTPPANKPAAKPAATPGARSQIRRLPWGHPDFRGVWSFAMLTPLERPEELKDKEVLTEAEAIQYQDAIIRALDHDTPEGAERVCKGTGNYNEFWYDRGNEVAKTRRTSLIIDPPDGKIPPLTAAGQRRAKERAAYRASRGPADSWTDRGLGERCMIGFNSGPPMMPSAYNNNMQIFQTKDTFVILNEMVHDSRVIPLDGRPHTSSKIRSWAGDSRGRWEGDTMVIETVNLREENLFRGAGPNLKLVEKFSRVGADTLLYEVTVIDPDTFTTPWTLQIPMSPSNGRIYEYACHEHNYGLAGILAGHRMEEREAAEAAAGKKP
jgi:hypothetical protein